MHLLAFSPELVWGLIPRFVGVLYILAFGALIPQLIAMVGSRGIGPIAPRLAAARRDYPGFRRFRIFPTLFWISSSDRTIALFPWLGVACGVLCMYGGPLSPYAHVAAWLLWLSLEPAGMLFPWDTMLMEAGFLSLFLPTANALPSLLSESLPYPAVAFVFRFFVLRLMLGFGKVKFLGSGRDDGLYLRGFFAWSSTTPLAWYAHHLPAWMLRGMLFFMFVGEVIAPLLGFFAGPLRIVSFVMLAGLMVGIQAMGNWGYFNVGYILLSVCLLDARSSIFDLGSEPWRSTLWEWPQLGINALMGLLFLTGLLYLIASDSWTMRTLVHWPLDRFTWNRRWLRLLLAYLRAISPLRIVNGYGVFPPKAQPPMLQLPLFEGSDDGVTWKAYRYRFMPTSPGERNHVVAPFHPRMDMGSAYACHCMFDASFYSNIVGDGTPYSSYTRSSALERTCQLLLRAEPTGMPLVGLNPFPDAPPKLLRVSTVALTPAHPAVRRATGEQWHVRRLGVTIPAHGQSDWQEAHWIPEPEVFHPDWVEYKRKARSIQALSRAFASGVEPSSAVLTESDLTAEEVRSFWEDFLPCANEHRGDFSRHDECARALEARFGKLQLMRFERILERFAWFLRLRTERHQFADAKPNLPIASNFRYHMFLHELVMDGREAYEAYLGDVTRVVQRLERSSDETQLWTVTLLRHSVMVPHMATFRWTLIGADMHKRNVPGLFEYYPLLSKYPTPGEEFRPVPSKRADGDYDIPGLYPPPQLPLAERAERTAE